MDGTPPAARRIDALASWEHEPEEHVETSQVSQVSGERELPTGPRWSLGQVVADRYRLEKLIGEGGASHVYAAHDQLHNRAVALKLLTLDGSDRGQLEGRFRREIEVATQLHGPAFVPVFDHGVRPECGFIAMELLIGESLQDRLTRVRRLDLDSTVGVIREIAAGLAVAHDLCIVHRDLKPANVFLCRGGTERAVKILDFGIAKDLWTSSKLTHNGALVGSPHYVSPEQARCVEIDHRSDLWSLGVVIYRCLTGARPFDGSPAQLILRIVKDPHERATKIAPDLPPSLDAFFERALAKRPEERFQDVGSMLSAIAQIADEARHGSGVRPAVKSDAPASARARPTSLSERTRVGAAGYDAYVAMVSRMGSQEALADDAPANDRAGRERLSFFPTVEVASPLLAADAVPDSRRFAPPESRPLSPPLAPPLAPRQKTIPVGPPESLERRPLAPPQNNIPFAPPQDFESRPLAPFQDPPWQNNIPFAPPQNNIPFVPPESMSGMRAVPPTEAQSTELLPSPWDRDTQVTPARTPGRWKIDAAIAVAILGVLIVLATFVLSR